MASSVGWRARRELRRLAKAGDRGDQNAIEAVWQAWLAHRDDARWDLLAQWRDPGELARAVSAAAVDPDRAPGEREAIGQFCARHGLMPDDDIQQVLFYVLTGQLARYRAADARGRLPGAVYQRAGHRTRTALQQALTEVRVWYLDGAQTELLASASVLGARNPVVISGRDQIGVLTTKGNRVRVFEGVKPRKARAPKGFPGQAVRRQWNSANDRIWMLAGAKFATVFPGRHSVLTVADRVPLPGGCLACLPAGPAVIGHRRCAAQLLPSDTDMT